MQPVFDIDSYNSRLKDLFERFQSVQKSGFTAASYKPGLDGMLRLSAALGHPWKRYPCIHVAGTNGKGSVCSMLASTLASGRRIGLYTSPHLLDFRERMKIVSGGGFEMISREEVWEFLNSYEAEFEGLSFFEITTGMAFWWFARRGVDAAVIEVGLGGRLDSTNIITPVLSVVTSIGLDHCALLGSTRAEIAFEKAGIFKPGVPAVVGVRDAETAPVFEEVAGRVGCPLTFASDLPAVTYRDNIFASESELLARMDLTGPCQDINLHTVLVALNDLPQKQWAPSPKNSQNRGRSQIESICSAAERTGLWGRWQKVSGDPEVICDIGHNPPALKENFARLDALQRCDGKQLIIVYGIMADKDLAGIAPMMPSGARYILTAPDSPRSMPADELSARLKLLRPDPANVDKQGFAFETVPCVADAVHCALALAQDLPNPLIYIGGSTFVVAEALPLFNKTTES